MMRNELRATARVMAAIMLIALLSMISGCGGSSPAPSVTITPSASSVNAGGSVSLSASVANGKGSGGVNWTLAPASGCGSLGATTGATVTYTAPKESEIAADCTATITATSADSASTLASQTITSKAVSLSLGTGVSQIVTLDASGSKTLTVSLANDASGSAAINWTINGASSARHAMSASCGSLSAATGASVTYTAPGVGNCTATITASVSANPNVKQTFTVNVNAPLAITTAALKSTYVQSSYSVQLAASGGQTPYVWSMASGSVLPTGMTITADGLISGGTLNYGNYNVAIAVTDALGAVVKQSYTLTVNPATLSLGCAKIGPAYVGETYSGALESVGGVGDGAYALVSGALPQGLSFVSGNGITGTPTNAGDYAFTVKETDSATGGFQQTATASCSITVNPALAITSSATLPMTAVGASYSQQLTASGGSGANTWSLASGSTLPAGLTLSSAGLISGSPTAYGSYNFTVQVTNKAGATAKQSVALDVQGPPFTLDTTTLPDAVQGKEYSYTMKASGGVPPYRWAAHAEANFPVGMGIDPDSGHIFGTPGFAGTYTIKLWIYDNGVYGSTRQTLQPTVTLVVKNPDPAITTTSLGYAFVGQSYSAQLTASGGTAPLAWSLASGSSLPDGLSLSASGAISGSPNAASSSNVTFVVTDADSRTAQSTLALNAYAKAAITTTTLPDGADSTAYSQQLSAGGGIAPYTWSLDSGSLPAGLTLSSSGLISGTPTGFGGSSFTVKAVDSASGAAQQSVTKQLTIKINTPTLSITTAQLPDTYQGAAYSQQLQSTGGYGSITWSIASGSLNSGLTLSPSGLISGAVGDATGSNFCVQAADAATGSSQQTVQKCLSINSVSPLVFATDANLGNALNGKSYSTPLFSSGGTGVNKYTLASGSTLPAGLTLSSAGVISGTPTVNGGYSFTVNLSDYPLNGSTALQTVSRTFTMTVIPMLITTAATQPGLINHSFSLQMAAVGGTAPYTWSIASGSLPTGLSLSSTGSISGATNATPGVYTATVQVADSATPTAIATLPMTFNIASPTMALSPSYGFGGLIQNLFVTSNFYLTNAFSPYSVKLASGSLPPGMTLSSSGYSIALSGTPTTLGAYHFTVTITDQSLTGAPSSNTQQVVDFPMIVQVVEPLSIKTASLSDGVSGASYSQSLSAAGGAPAYNWTLCGGALPKGLTLSSSGVISGKAGAPGAYTACMRVTDSGDPTAGGILQTSSMNYTINVTADQLAVVTDTLPNGVVNLGYGAQVKVVGGSGDAKNYAASFSGLPTGVTASGLILSGSPTTAGDYPVTLNVSDASVSPTQNATASFTLHVGAAPTGVRNSIVHGNYVCLVNGRNDAVTSSIVGSSHNHPSAQLAFVFQMQADGSGAITGGYVDANAVNATVSVALTPSTYTVGYGTSITDTTDNRGLLNLSVNSDPAMSYALAASKINSSSVAERLYLSKIDDAGDEPTNLFGGGVCYLQDATAISSTTTASASTWLTGGFAYGLSGEDSAQSPIATGAVLTGAGMAITKVDADTLTVAGASNDVSSTGVITTDANSPLYGRLNLNLNGAKNFALYIIDANHGVLISTDQRAAQPLLVGEIRRQQSGSAVGHLIGSFVGHASGYKVTNGVVSGEAVMLDARSISSGTYAYSYMVDYSYDGLNSGTEGFYGSTAVISDDGRASVKKYPWGANPDYGAHYFYVYDQNRAFMLDGTLDWGGTNTRNLMLGEIVPASNAWSPTDGAYAMRSYSADPAASYSSGVLNFNFSAPSISGLYDDGGSGVASIGESLPADAALSVDNTAFTVSGNGQALNVCQFTGDASIICASASGRAAITELQQ